MYKTTVKIDGMVCAMCEAHVNDAVRKNFAVSSVKADKDKVLGMLCEYLGKE